MEFRRGQQQAPQVRRIPCVFEARQALVEARQVQTSLVRTTQALEVLQAKHEQLQAQKQEQLQVQEVKFRRQQLQVQKTSLKAVQVLQGKQQETITELKGVVEALQQKKRKRKRGKGNKKRGKRSSAQKRISASKKKKMLKKK